MYYSLNSLKGVIKGIIEGIIIGVIKGDTRSLDYGSYNPEHGDNWKKEPLLVPRRVTRLRARKSLSVDPGRRVQFQLSTALGSKTLNPETLKP